MGINPFKGTSQAEVTTRHPFLKPGFVGMIEVEKTVYITTKQKGDAFICEATVVESNMSDVHPIGQTIAWYQGFRDRTVALPSMKQFAMALCQVNSMDAETQEEFLKTLDDTLNEACESETLFQGYKVRVETEHTTTKNGGDFTRHLWQEYEGEQPQIAE